MLLEEFNSINEINGWEIPYRFIKIDGDMVILYKSGGVVEERTHTDNDDGQLGSTAGTEVPGLQGPADDNVPLYGDNNCQVDRGGLSSKTHWVHIWGGQGE